MAFRGDRSSSLSSMKLPAPHVPSVLSSSVWENALHCVLMQQQKKNLGKEDNHTWLDIPVQQPVGVELCKRSQDCSHVTCHLHRTQTFSQVLLHLDSGSDTPGIAHDYVLVAQQDRKSLCALSSVCLQRDARAPRPCRAL